MTLERINPAGLAPAQGFSHAVAGVGRTVHLAGQTALDGSGKIAGRSVAEQFERALANILAALAAAGGAPADLASMTIYVTDIADYRSHSREIGEVWRRLAGREYPAMACVEVVRLWDDEACVELQGIALVPDSEEYRNADE